MKLEFHEGTIEPHGLVMWATSEEGPADMARFPVALSLEHPDNRRNARESLQRFWDNRHDIKLREAP